MDKEELQDILKALQDKLTDAEAVKAREFFAAHIKEENDLCSQITHNLGNAGAQALSTMELLERRLKTKGADEMVASPAFAELPGLFEAIATRLRKPVTDTLQKVPELFPGEEDQAREALATLTIYYQEARVIAKHLTGIIPPGQLQHGQ